MNEQAMIHLKHIFSTAILAALLAGCITAPIDDEEPIGTDPPPEPDPAPVSFSIEIEYDKISVSGDCDFAPFGNAGDFQYRVGYRVRPAGSSFEGALTVVESTSNFDTKDGAIVKVDAGKSHDVDAKTTFTLTEGGGYFVQFDLREWDGNDRDLSMDSEHGSSRRGFTPIKDNTGTRDFSIQVGKNDQCRAKLEGSVKESIANRSQP
jgi:hypothetical protein